MLRSEPVTAGVAPNASNPVMNFLRSIFAIPSIPFRGFQNWKRIRRPTAWNLYADWGFFTGELRLSSRQNHGNTARPRQKSAAFRRRLSGAGDPAWPVFRLALVCGEGVDRHGRGPDERLGLDVPGPGDCGDHRPGRRSDGAGF